MHVDEVVQYCLEKAADDWPVAEHLFASGDYDTSIRVEYPVSPEAIPSSPYGGVLADPAVLGTQHHAISIATGLRKFALTPVFLNLSGPPDCSTPVLHSLPVSAGSDSAWYLFDDGLRWRGARPNGYT
ncbi:MAG: hypothetical protein O7G88_06685 [bacterium]|nr:hypothetical protein [bacterium]